MNGSSQSTDLEEYSKDGEEKPHLQKTTFTVLGRGLRVEGLGFRI